MVNLWHAIFTLKVKKHVKKYHLYALGAALASIAILSFKAGHPSSISCISENQVKWIKNGEAILPGGSNNKLILSGGNQKLYAFKIKMLEGGVNLLRCDIEYADGKTTSITLRNDVQQGEESREINNPTPPSPISKIIFWYDNPKQSAKLEWWSKVLG